MKKGKKVMLWILGVVVVLILAAVIWFNVPYSPIKSEFEKTVTGEIAETAQVSGIFTEEDISKLPSPVQRYFKYCGYIGKPKMSNMRINFNDVDFILSPDKPKLKLKYTQYNFSDRPERIALIDSRLYGIPFEGMDAYIDGKGSMKGVIAKAVTLFDQRGEVMDRASLVTCLSESLLIPTFALQDFISWEEIDNNHVKATITHYGISASGVFTFDDNGEITSFTTDERGNVDMNGNVRMVKWSAVFEDYKDDNGIKHPATLKGIWHYETGDVVYFDGRGIELEYNVKE